MAESARRLSFFDVYCLGINAIIGSGIFLFPGKLAKTAGPTSIFAFLMCGVLLITVALCYAEMAGICRRNGGAYVYAREAFGPQIGFVVGWIALLTSIFSWATVASAISAYLGYFHPVFDTPPVAKGLACTLIILFATINYLGVKLGAMTVNVFTVAKILPLLLFVGVGLFHLQPELYQPLMGISTGIMGSAIFLSLWPLQGFETTPVVAGETRHPNRDVPWATIGSLLTVTVFYTLIQIVAVGTLPNLASSARPLAEAAGAFLGPWGASLIAIGAFISMTGYLSGNALGCPRYLEALAQDRFLPHLLAQLHPKYLTPSRAILWTAGPTLLMVLFLDFSSLVDISNMAVISQYLSTCLAVIWLRIKQPERERGFRIPGGVAIPLLGCVVSLWLVQNVKLPEFLFTLGAIGVGVLVSQAFKRFAPATP
jgi:APA family basic amino acid/polyamine antiporter